MGLRAGGAIGACGLRVSCCRCSHNARVCRLFLTGSTHRCGFCYCGCFAHFVGAWQLTCSASRTVGGSSSGQNMRTRPSFTRPVFPYSAWLYLSCNISASELPGRRSRPGVFSQAALSICTARDFVEVDNSTDDHHDRRAQAGRRSAGEEAVRPRRLAHAARALRTGPDARGSPTRLPTAVSQLHICVRHCACMSVWFYGTGSSPVLFTQVGSKNGRARG